MNRSGISLNIIWPLLIILLAGLLFFQATNSLTNTALDLLRRASPALLIGLGLMLFLGRRIRYGNLIAVVITVAMVAGTITVAYSQGTNRYRTDYAVPANYTIDPGIASASLKIQVLQTDLELQATDKRLINGQFVGSLESSVAVNYSQGNFSLIETPRNAIPSLDLVGRGKVTLSVPSGVPINKLEVTDQSGAVTLDGSKTTIKTLNIAVNSGNISVKFSPASGLIGDLKTGQGDVTVEIPSSVAAQIDLRGAGASAPQYNDTIYILDRSGRLIPKGVTNTQMQLVIEASGKITIK